MLECSRAIYAPAVFGGEGAGTTAAIPKLIAKLNRMYEQSSGQRVLRLCEVFGSLRREIMPCFESMLQNIRSRSSRFCFEFPVYSGSVAAFRRRRTCVYLVCVCVSLACAGEICCGFVSVSCINVSTCAWTSFHAHFFSPSFCVYVRVICRVSPSPRRSRCTTLHF